MFFWSKLNRPFAVGVPVTVGSDQRTRSPSDRVASRSIARKSIFGRNKITVALYAINFWNHWMVPTAIHTQITITKLLLIHLTECNFKWIIYQNVIIFQRENQWIVSFMLILSKIKIFSIILITLHIISFRECL